MAKLLLETDQLTASLRDDGIVHVVARGMMTKQSVVDIAEPLYAMYQAQAPVLHLLDVNSLSTEDLSARWQLSEMMKHQREFIKRSAVLGIDGAKRMTATVVVKVSGRKNIRFFDTDAEATTWLLSSD